MRSIVLIIFLIILGSCTEEKNTATLLIAMPEASRAPQSLQAMNPDIGQLSTSVWDNSITSESLVKCFAVFVGGDDEILRRNFCNEKDTDNLLVNFGDYYGAIARDGGLVEIELEADVEREITILALGSETGICPNFQGFSPPSGVFSYPRVIHQQSYVFQSGSQTVDISMPSTFDSTVPEIDICQFDSPDEPSVVIPEIPPAQLTFAEGTSFDFGEVAINGVTTHSFTLTNLGEQEATGMTFNSMAAPFSYTGGSFPGTGGTCGASLAVGASCTLSIDFAPTAGTNSTINLQISFNDGEQPAQSNLAISGLGGNLAYLTSSPAASPFVYGNTVNGGSVIQLFTIQNVGTSIATSMTNVGLATPFRFTGGSYPGSGGNCGFSLAISGTCQIEIEFAPVAIGTFSDRLTIGYNNSSYLAQLNMDLQGTAGAPANLTIAGADPYDFGTLTSGATQPVTLTMSNSGSVAATSIADGAGLAAPYSYVGGSYPGTGGDCGTTLAAGTTCNLAIQFAPSGVGVANDTLIINYNDGTGANSYNHGLTGTGANPANLTITESDPYDYGPVTVGDDDSHTFTLNNTGGVPASSIVEIGLAAPFNFEGGSFPGTGGTCGASINTGATCTVVIEYSPTATGLQSDTINFSYNNGASSVNVTRDVQGTGITPALLTVSGADPYDYGTQPTGSVSNNVFTVTNAGGSTASAMGGSGLLSPFSFTGGSYPGTAGTCGATLAAGANCDIDVTYSPTVTSASDTDTIDINYYNGVSSVTSSRDVQGTAVAPALLTISETDPYNFGSVANPGVLTHSFTISNTGGYVATAIAEVGIFAPFDFTGASFPGTSGTCTTSLAPAGTCTIEIEFAPGVTSPFSDTINIQYNDGVTSQSSSRDIQGTGL